MKYPEMRSTAFGEVLAELMEARDIPVTPFNVGERAEDAGLDGWKVLDRMTDAAAEWPGYLDGLADSLGLSEAERMELAFAYTYGQRRPASHSLGYPPRSTMVMVDDDDEAARE